MEPVLGDISVFVEGVETVHQVYILLDAENVGVVEQVEEQPEETEQDQWDPIVAEEESQQRHFGVDAGDREGNLREGVSNEWRGEVEDRNNYQVSVRSIQNFCVSSEIAVKLEIKCA